MEYSNYAYNNLYPSDWLHHKPFENEYIQDSKRIKLDCQEPETVTDPVPSTSSELTTNEQIQAEVARRLQEKLDADNVQLQNYLEHKLSRSRFKEFKYNEHMKRAIPEDPVDPLDVEKVQKQNESIRRIRFEKNRDEFFNEQATNFAKISMNKLKTDISKADRKIEELEEMVKLFGGARLLENMKEPYEHVKKKKNAATTSFEIMLMMIFSYEDFEEGLHDNPQSTLLLSGEDFRRTMTNPIQPDEQENEPFIVHDTNDRRDIHMADNSPFQDEDYFSYEENPLDLRIDWKKYEHELDS